ncbi:MAG TPA: ammonium transporter [Oceanospirillales bacterium]|nr:ammonium transporter [Oceanospirillaceae bacterium]HBS41992.1 ammonium transporter [Oceanospirillales bacterium]
MSRFPLLPATLLLTMATPAMAESAEPVVVDTVWVITATALVFFMQAGFALLESGMARAKNAVNVMMKNYMDVCIGSLFFWAFGFGLMFGNNPTGLFGTSAFAMGSVTSWEYTFLAFQMMFAATAVTICSGAMAERTKYSSYLAAACVIIAVVYPVFGSWVWGGTYGGSGWLADMGFIDFAGSTVVHSVGAWCALAGVMVVGPRTGRFSSTGISREIPGHSLTLVALGGFILWLGWFGFNGGSTLEASTDIGKIVLNTHLSASAGAAGALLYSRLRGKPVLLSVIVNGSIAGLVGITAGCATMTPPFAVLTGIISGIISVMGVAVMERWRLDDVVSAVPVHGFAGIWGTLAAGLFFAGDMFSPERFAVQSLGVISAFVWAFPLSYMVFYVIKLTVGLRSSRQHEQVGLDYTEHSEIGYPEFQKTITYHKES